MRIAVVMLTSGGMSGGAVKYLRRILPYFASSSRVAGFRLYVPESLHGVEGATPFTSRAELKTAIASFGADVVFIPTARWIDCGATPTVVMVRNMEPLEVPFENNPPLERLRNLARRTAARSASMRAGRVIAVSQHVRDFLVSRWQLDRGKIGVVYHGVDRIPASRRPPAAGEVVAGSFLFTAGSIRPARGLDDLIEAISLAPRTLLIAGEADRATRRYAAALRRRTSGMPIVWLGTLTAQEMSWCFANCGAFVTTSRAEACPNTVLEAMAHGCLSLSTDWPPMPEMFGDAAMYYRARDGQDLAARIAALHDLTDRQKCELRERTLARAGEFTWERTASETVTQLEIALG